MSRRHASELLKTEFANSGRIAGDGITYDHYDEESGHRPNPKCLGRVRLPSDNLKPVELAALNGPVIIRRAKGEKP